MGAQAETQEQTEAREQAEADSERSAQLEIELRAEIATLTEERDALGAKGSEDRDALNEQLAALSASAAETAKFTPHRLDPREYKVLSSYGIGLTDMAKTLSGSDTDI